MAGGPGQVPSARGQLGQEHVHQDLGDRVSDGRSRAATPTQVTTRHVGCM